MATLSSHETLAPPANPPVGAGEAPHPQTLRSMRLAVLHAAPTALVVAALAGLAAWGHFADWKVPRFSALVGKSAAPSQPWCDEHNVPEGQCIECNADLLPAAADYGWCKVHGVAQCPLEHPDVAQLPTPPVITQPTLDRAARALALKPRPENNSLCRLHLKRIQFASAEAVEKAGIDVAVVAQQPIVETIVAPGEIVYDPTRMAHLSSRVAGTVWKVARQLGDRVVQGECLALIDAAEVGKAKSELLQAIAQLRLKQAHWERMKPLAEEALPARQIREAQTGLEEAKIRLHTAVQSLVNLGLPVPIGEFADLEIDEVARRIHFLGLPPEIVSGLDPSSTTSNLFPICSPLDGIVIEAHVVPGEVVDTSSALFGVADVTRLWLMLSVREEDARYVDPGQAVLFRPNRRDAEDESRGTVAWISTAIDQTRTVKVRVELPNAGSRLRANTFGVGRIVLREEPQAVVVPREALHWDGNCHVVFVRDKDYHQPRRPKFFYVRSVRPGVSDGQRTEIIAGLVPGEVIASKNSNVLIAQLLKSNLGAGCGCVDGH